jgi:ribonuclease HI
MVPQVKELAIIHFDGGGQSPGPITAACVVELSDGSVVQDVKRFDQGTHNTAEWHALILGLRLARKHGERHVVVKGDSTLVVKQVNREWNTKSPALRPLRTQAEGCWRSSRARASSGFRARRTGAPTNLGGPNEAPTPPWPLAATSALDEKR